MPDLKNLDWKTVIICAVLGTGTGTGAGFFGSSALADQRIEAVEEKLEKVEEKVDEQSEKTARIDERTLLILDAVKDIRKEQRDDSD